MIFLACYLFNCGFIHLSDMFVDTLLLLSLLLFSFLLEDFGLTSFSCAASLVAAVVVVVVVAVVVPCACVCAIRAHSYSTVLLSVLALIRQLLIHRYMKPKRQQEKHKAQHH